ncbi:MAG: hypothetical protein JWM10_96 [Myxococcaceae bacterium]|nr:hypothetical protein [Myxococcaceae bacterium]
MIHLGCSGFPVPATRYLKEFRAVEVADTMLGVPGPALIRRWRREAPEGFLFTALAPKEVSADGFKPSAAGQAAWEAFLPVVRDLDARAIIVTSAPEMTASKLHRPAVRAFFESLAQERSLPPLVWEAPASWELRDAEATVKDLAVVVARDPLRHPPIAKGALGCFRLPGPAGFKSRYEDPALEAAAATIRASRCDEMLVALCNVDMYADAKRLRKLLDA